ncbi:TRAP transporter substrate-binding protein [Parvibium lacunae]|uniref:C4-dicarboxylate ABC transporter n=1 Tax=Parvibium lacunae TaxID=1888893 RepID=A0A368L0B6_9BURK|nr:TRAP transporter substrate-binding protein [Parvibium lacunae]RCS57003.1 C4-dicarboxylate ABC transporter [Parvibium lacunae]
MLTALRHQIIEQRFVPLLVTLLVSAASSPLCWAQTQVAIASAYPADSFQTKNLQQFADEVNGQLGQSLKLTIHPNGQLAKPAEIYPQAKEGKIGGGEVIMSSLEKFAPIYGIDSIPFTVRGYDDAKRLWRYSRAAIDAQMQKDGLKLLYAVPWPPQNLYTTQKLDKVSDARGLKMRTYNPATEKIAEFIGAKSVLFQVVELEKAIAEEKLDLMITSSWTGVQTKAWSKLRYYYPVNAWIPKNVVFIRASTFNQLPKDSAEKLMRLAQAAEDRGWSLSQLQDKEFEDLLKQNKVTLVKDMPYLLDEFRRLGEKMSREWLRKSGQDGLDALMHYELDRFQKR